MPSIYLTRHLTLELSEYPSRAWVHLWSALLAAFTLRDLRRKPGTATRRCSRRDHSRQMLLQLLIGMLSTTPSVLSRLVLSVNWRSDRRLSERESLWLSSKPCGGDRDDVGMHN